MLHFATRQNWPQRRRRERRNRREVCLDGRASAAIERFAELAPLRSQGLRLDLAHHAGAAAEGTKLDSHVLDEPQVKIGQRAIVAPIERQVPLVA